MKSKTILSIAALLLCLCQCSRSQETEVVPVEKLTKEQFQALPPEALIDFKGERMTKAHFLKSRAVQAEQFQKRLKEMKAKTQEQAEARRTTFLQEEKTKLEEANKKVQAEIDRLVAADNASHGPNWQERKRQAAKILAEASKATPEDRLELERKAADLLAPASP